MKIEDENFYIKYTSTSIFFRIINDIILLYLQYKELKIYFSYY